MISILLDLGRDAWCDHGVIFLVVVFHYSVPGRESRVNNGRVQKFRSEDYQDDSDDMGTYNGNSTQQQ